MITSENALLRKIDGEQLNSYGTFFFTHPDPAIRPGVVGLHSVRGTAAAPSPDGEQDLMGDPGPGALRSLDHPILLGDGLHVHQHL